MTPALERLIGRVVGGNTDVRPMPKPLFGETNDQTGFEIVDEQVAVSPFRHVSARPAPTSRLPSSEAPDPALPSKPPTPTPPAAERHAAAGSPPGSSPAPVAAAPRNSARADDEPQQPEVPAPTLIPSREPFGRSAEVLERTRYVTLAPRRTPKLEDAPAPVAAPMVSRSERAAPVSAQRPPQTARRALAEQPVREATPPPVVTIEIGHIQVRPPAPAPQTAPRPPRRSPALTLDAYLDQRQRGLR